MTQTSPICFDTDAIFADLRSRGITCTAEEQRTIASIVADEAGQYNPNATIGANFGIGLIMQPIVQALMFIGECFGIGVSHGVNFSNLGASLNEAFSATSQRTQLWDVTQMSHTVYNRLLQQGGHLAQIAALVSGNTAFGDAPLEHNLYSQGAAITGVSQAVRHLGPNLNRAEQGPQPIEVPVSEQRYPVADNPPVTAPSFPADKSATNALTAKPSYS